MGIENNRIVATLTVGELKSVIAGELKEHAKVEPPHHSFTGWGIMKMFGVSHGTAQHTRTPSWHRPALRRERTFFVDQELAIKLFADNKRRVVDIVEPDDDIEDEE